MLKEYWIVVSKKVLWKKLIKCHMSQNSDIKILNWDRYYIQNYYIKKLS